MRDAENGEAFLGEIEWSYGFVTRLLSGDEEAALMLRGVGEIEPGTLVLDIGGGSTELVTLDSRLSIDVGSVRLTDASCTRIRRRATSSRPAQRRPPTPPRST